MVESLGGKAWTTDHLGQQKYKEEIQKQHPSYLLGTEGSMDGTKPENEAKACDGEADLGDFTLD